MTITYANGQTIKAALVVRTDNTIRVVLAGSDDVTEFTCIGGAWVSEDCEAVRIEYGWPVRIHAQYTDEDYICPKDLAAQLIHMLLNPEDEEESTAPVPSPSLASTAAHMIV
jgi:hypothetical protein